MKDLKSAILEATDGGRRIFEDLYPDARGVFANNAKGYIKLRAEKTASACFKLIEGKERYWILKDFGDDTTFNAIDAYMHEKGVRFFAEALHQLADIYKLKDAIRQDKAAIEFVIKLCQKYESAKNALEKLKNKGASI